MTERDNDERCSITIGRPTKNDDEALHKAQDYLKNYDILYDHAVPSIQGLACVLGVARSSLYLWAEKDENFSDILEFIKQIQFTVALSKSLKGKYNANIAKLLLAKHGLKDSGEDDADNNAEPLTITFDVAEPVKEVKVTHGKPKS